MKFSNLVLLAAAFAESAAASRCKPKSAPLAQPSAPSSSLSQSSPSSPSSPSPPSSTPSSSSSLLVFSSVTVVSSADAVSSAAAVPSSSSTVLPSSSVQPTSSLPSSSSVHGSSSSTSSSHSSSSSPAPSQPPSSSLSLPSLSPSSFVTSTRTASAAPVVYSEPASDCADLVNGNFATGQLSPWYNSDQQTTNIAVVSEGPSTGDHAFAMVPAQTQYAQVYINQPLPYCGNVPAAVVIRAQFSYMFTSYSTGCQINIAVNQGGPVISTVSQTGHAANTWYTYSGPATHVTLGYTPLFTVQMSCSSNTPQKNAVLVTDIKAYA